MQLRICLFVDGENFRHSICDLFPRDFDKSDYLPKQADWENMFDHLAEKVAFRRGYTRGSGYHVTRIRTYWYVVENFDFYPYHLDSLKSDEDAMYRELLRHAPFRAELESLGGAERLARAQDLLASLLREQGTMRKRFDGWRTIQQGIENRHPAIEFRRAGNIRYNLLERRFEREKAVDVKLAVDLITLRETYDLALLFSGDQDYVPAVQVVKDMGKQIANISFARKDGSLLPGGARRLNEAADWSYSVPEHDLRNWLQIAPLAGQT